MRKGFTLIELIIYLGIFAALSGIFSSLLITYTRLHSQQAADTEINNQINFALQKIQRLIASPDAAAIFVNDGALPKDQDRGISNDYLVIRRKDITKDPTRVYVDNSVTPAQLVIEEGSLKSVINSNKVTLAPGDLFFTKISNYPSHDLIKISLKLTHNAISPNNIARTIVSTIGRASAATFDDNIFPGTNGLNIGTIGNKWQNGYFAGVIKADSGVQVSTPSTGRPSCTDSSNRGLIWVIPGIADTTKDRVEICAKNIVAGSDVWGWQLLW